MTKSDLIDLTVKLIHATDKAWLITDDDTREVWIPKAAGELEKNKDGTFTLTIPESLALTKGLI